MEHEIFEWTRECIFCLSSASGRTEVGVRSFGDRRTRFKDLIDQFVLTTVKIEIK